MIHDGVEVVEHCFEAEIVNITLRVTGAAAVVEHEPEVLPKPLVRVAETRNSPLAEHVAEWGGRQPDQRSHVARHRIGDGDTVTVQGVPDAGTTALTRCTT